MITQGTWKHEKSSNAVRDKRGFAIVHTQSQGGMDAIANAHLIAEAGTVYNETGFTPRQLIEQRGALLEACKAIMQAESTPNPNVMEIATKTFARCHKAITKAEGQ